MKIKIKSICKQANENEYQAKYRRDWSQRWRNFHWIGFLLNFSDRNFIISMNGEIKNNIESNVKLVVAVIELAWR